MFISLAAADSESHLDALMQITDILQDEERTAKILQARNVLELYQYFK